MRSILDKSKEETRKKRNILVLSGFLIVIMVLSTLGYAFYQYSNDSEEKEAKAIKYNGLEFKQTSYETWIFNLSKYNFETRFNPEQARNISAVLTENIRGYMGAPVYFGINSEKDISAAGNKEILNNLNQFVLRSNFACIDENCSADYPIKNCSKDNIIIFKKSGRFTEIESKEKCVLIYSSEEDVERASDAFLFKILGIT